jgi:protein TonB
MIARAFGVCWKWAKWLVCVPCLTGLLCAPEAQAFQSPAQELRVSTPQPVRISQGVARALLSRKVAPDYPAEARSKHIEGRVVMMALITKTGDVEKLYPISGDELLIPSAMKAVKEWKYKPYLLQGQPTEVETQITVVFTLDGG